jgi:putative alpha-1,2-mannosidase
MLFRHTRTAKRICALVFIVSILVTQAQSQSHSTRREVDFVDPFIGTGANGHTYPGATVPFGMVQLSPDNGLMGWEWCSGYRYVDSVIVGFSHTHFSGTGCADLGDILVTPALELPPADSLLHWRFRHEDEKAVPGYYYARLPAPAIEVKLTVTERVGFHRYIFSRNRDVQLILNLGYGNSDIPVETELKVESPTVISGYRISTGWARDQRIFFVAEFSQPIQTSLVAKEHGWQSDTNEISGKSSKAALAFSLDLKEPLLVKVAISGVSVEGARQNLKAEIPHWDFDAVRHAAEETWQKELSRIRVIAHSQVDEETFYTALYHAFLAPTLFSDVNGDYRGGDGQVHHAANFVNYSTFSLWDTYRAEHPLFTIVQRERVADFVNSMLAFRREWGELPIWSFAGNETWCMIGYHSVPVIADAILKGFGGFDNTEAFEAMKGSALANWRGLQYYNLVEPRPLKDKLSELRAYDRELTNANEIGIGASDLLVSGYTRSLGGKTISYHSSYPYVKDALLTRATDGTMTIEWETEAVPTDVRTDTITFVWVAGNSTRKGGHGFDLFVDGSKWFTFHTSRDAARTSWRERAANGTELIFVGKRTDIFGDLFGHMFLRVPSQLLTPGKSLTLRVVGENGGSRDWYMTFEHLVQPDIRVQQAYARAAENGQRFQIVQALVEHLGPQMPATLTLESAEPLNVVLKPGLNSFYIPVAEVTSETPVTMMISSPSSSQTKTLTLHPIVPLGYVPADKEHESVSKTLEYAYDDWCIAQVAKALDKPDDFALFSIRASFYRNLFDPQTGFMRGKKSDGTWVSPFNPRHSTGLQPEYTEGNAWQYTWYVPHDVPGLMELLGGPEAFCAKLDTLFNQSTDLEGTGATPDVSGLIGMYAHGNEPSHHIAYLYTLTGQPWKTQELAQRIMHELYTNRNDGLCGNEDCGQMSAWYVFSAMGFYPVNPANGRYILGSPLFEQVQLDVGNGRTFTVQAENMSSSNIYVQAVRLNGEDYHRNYITHSDIVNGSTLTFVMGPQPKMNWRMTD